MNWLSWMVPHPTASTFAAPIDRLYYLILVLTGIAVSESKRTLGSRFKVRFQGQLDGSRFVLKGALDRSCTLVLARG